MNGWKNILAPILLSIIPGILFGTFWFLFLGGLSAGLTVMSPKGVDIGAIFGNKLLVTLWLVTATVWLPTMFAFVQKRSATFNEI